MTEGPTGTGPKRSSGTVGLHRGPVIPEGHFDWNEVRCNHCRKLPGDDEAVVNAARMMENIRRILGNRPIRVLSWYRCPAHNKAVGGASNSQHLFGRAVDFTLKDLSPGGAQTILKRYHGEGGFIKGLGRYHGFTHVDNRPGEIAEWWG